MFVENWLQVKQHIQFLLLCIPSSAWIEPSCTCTIFSWPHTQSRLLCYTLVLCLQLSSRDGIKKKNRLMESITLFVPATWEMLLTISLSSCSIKPLRKIVWQSCLLGEALHPLSNRHNFSSVDKSIITDSPGNLPVRNLEPYSKVRDSGSNGRTWLI